MMFRMLTVSLIVLVCGSSLIAQTDTTPADVVNAENPQLKALVDRHIEFVKQYYEPTDEEVTKIRDTLTKLIPLEEAYHLRTDLTMMRIRTAMTLLPAQATGSAADTQKIAAKFQQQVEKLRSDAPLSYKNAMKFAEKSLTKEQVEAGRARLQKAFAPTQGDASEFELDQLDLLVRGSIQGAAIPDMPMPEAISPADEKQVPEGIKKPTPPAQPAPKAPEPTAKPTEQQQPKPQAQSPVAKPPVQGTLEPAPPVDQWAAEIGKLATQYEFDRRKQVVASVILQTYVDRATEYREKESESYEATERIADAAEKAATIKKLNGPIDEMYDELCRRIRSLSQAQTSEKAE